MPRRKRRSRVLSTPLPVDFLFHPDQASWSPGRNRRPDGVSRKRRVQLHHRRDDRCRRRCPPARKSCVRGLSVMISLSLIHPALALHESVIQTSGASASGHHALASASLSRPSTIRRRHSPAGTSPQTIAPTSGVSRPGFWSARRTGIMSEAYLPPVRDAGCGRTSSLPCRGYKRGRRRHFPSSTPVPLRPQCPC